MVISAFAVSYYYITPANPRLQRSQQDVSQLGYNILNSLAANGEFNDQIINGAVISTHYTSCSYSNPSVSISPGSKWNSPGGSNTYTVTVVNNDNLCGVELFQLSLVLPSTSWTGSIQIPTLSAASDGGSTSTLVTVKSPSTAGSGTYNFTVTATNIANSVSSADASATASGAYSIQTGSECIQNDPTVTSSPNPESAAAGDNMSFSIIIVNNDRNCGLESYSVSVLPPGPGWSVVLAAPEVQVYSGDWAADTVYLTSPANTPAGNNFTRVVVTNMENVLDSTSSIISYKITSPVQGCSHSSPAVAVDDTSESGASGTTLTYAISIANMDTGCGVESFGLSVNVPTGFTYSFQPNLVPVNVTSGGSAGLTLTLTSQSNLPAANYSFTIQATSTSTNSVTAQASGTYASSGPESCQYYNPSVSVSPPSEWGGTDSSVTYTVSVVNNDLSVCSPDTFQLTFTSPSGSAWSGILTPPSLLINSAGGTSIFTLKLTSPSTVTPGKYTFTVTATNEKNLTTDGFSSGSYNVEAPCTTVTLSCLGKIGAIVPGWQRNVDVALVSVVPEGYVYNLTVYLAYSPPGQPYDVMDIPLNNGSLITNGVPQSFKNAGQVTDVLYVYTTPKLYVLLFQLQLAQVTSP